MKMAFSLMSVLTVFALGLIISISMSSAYPNGAGGCAGGMAAVGPPHMIGQVTTGTLSKGGFTVLLDSKPLTHGVATSFAVGKTHVLALKAPASGFFRGVLFRLGSKGGVNTKSSLSVISGDTDLQVAEVCTLVEKAGGLTHTSGSAKTIASGHLLLNSAASNLPLDVTVVVQNDAGVNIYYYTQFTLNAVSSKAPVPTKKPVAPIKKPVSPTRKPTKKPTKKPTSRPVARPILRSTPTHHRN